MIRLKDIATHAGVDISTVSRALSEDPEINIDTQEKIKKIAGELGYKKKLRQVRSGKIPGLVGIIVPEVLSDYYSEMLSKIHGFLADEEKIPLLGITDFDSSKAGLYINGFAKAGAEGIIYIMDAFEESLSPQTEQLLKSCGIPVVFITGSYQKSLEFDSVYIDELSGIQKAISHLIELGHRSIGYIGESRTAGRYESYKAVLKEHGLEHNPLYCCAGNERLEEGGDLRMKELLAQKDRPTAVFIAYDQMAIGAINTLSEHGCTVPQDMSIIGFDNINASRFVLGGLTTVATPMEDTAAVTVKLLLERIGADTSKAVQHVTIRPTLEIRGSTAAPLR